MQSPFHCIPLSSHRFYRWRTWTLFSLWHSLQMFQVKKYLRPPLEKGKDTNTSNPNSSSILCYFYLTLYRHTSCIVLCFTVHSRYCIFLQIEGLWQLCADHVYLHPFFQEHLLTSHLCVTFWQFLQDLKLLPSLHLLWICVISDFWCYYYDSLKVQMTGNISEQWNF